MYKIAHRAEVSQRFICNEFGILQELHSSEAPVVKIGEIPLVDEHGIFGFTMEELYPIMPKDIPLYYEDIENALDKVHKLGYIITDVTVSNVMLTDEGQVRLIDFGQAGKLGEPLPEYHPFRRLGKRTFEVDMDLVGLERIKQRTGLIPSCS
jgi:RIO-like serine/threonine protein kinase